MIPKYRAWYKEWKEMGRVGEIRFDLDGSVSVVLFKGNYLDVSGPREKIVLMQSTGLKDKNGKEIFEGDILKFNDEWNDYCYEGYVDGSTEGINFVEIERETTSFTFGKFQTSDSSLLYFMKDEYLSFEDLITDKDFEFEIVGNIYENPELLEDN